MVHKENLYSRNWLFIDDDTQKKLNEIKVLVCGSGLGSYVAELLLRTGVTNIAVADGDVVNLSNLNRQSYLITNLLVNKAVTLKNTLKNINQDANVECIDRFLDSTALEILIPKYDFIINTIDFDNIAFVDCSNICRKYNKVELFPTNLGFGGSIIVGMGECPTFESFFNESDRPRLKTKIINFLLENASPRMKSSLQKYARSKIPYDPQLGISSFITSAMLVTLIIKIITAENVKIFPEFYYCDLFAEQFE